MLRYFYEREGNLFLGINTLQDFSRTLQRVTNPRTAQLILHLYSSWKQLLILFPFVFFFLHILLVIAVVYLLLRQRRQKFAYSHAICWRDWRLRFFQFAYRRTIKIFKRECWGGGRFPSGRTVTIEIQTPSWSIDFANHRGEYYVEWVCHCAQSYVNVNFSIL